nr:hypothetical protein [uncultured Janthinobacterium sp.]
MKFIAPDLMFLLLIHIRRLQHQLSRHAMNCTLETDECLIWINATLFSQVPAGVMTPAKIQARGAAWRPRSATVRPPSSAGRKPQSAPRRRFCQA